MRQGDISLRVIQITDSHIQAQANGELYGVNVDASLNAVLQHAQQHHWPADFMLATGDLVQDNGAAYPRFRAMLEPLAVPVYCLPGNHDAPGVFQQALASGSVRFQRQVVAGGWQFILLDSTIPGSDAGELSAPELAALETALAQHPSLPTMVCLHHQPVPVGSAWLDTMAIPNHAELFAIFERHTQVRVLLWGHVHQEFNGERGGIQLFSTPSTCAQFLPDSVEAAIDTAALPAYRWFELAVDGTVKTGVEWVELAAA